MATTGFGFGSRPVDLDRAVYTTITVMSVLIVYDGWQNLKLWAAVGVILRPVIAKYVSHVFSTFLARQAGLHQRPGRSEQMRIIRTVATSRSIFSRSRRRAAIQSLRRSLSAFAACP